MNEGVNVATGEILLFLDSNAYLADEETITDVVRLFVSNPDVDTVFGNAALDRGEGVVQKRQLHEMNRSLMATRSIALETLFVRKEAFQQTGGFSEMYREAADYDWILGLFLKRQCNYRHIDRLISVRIDDGQLQTREEKIERRRIIRKYYSRGEIFKYRTVPVGVARAKAAIGRIGLK